MEDGTTEAAELRDWVVDVHGFGRVHTGIRVRAASREQADELLVLEQCDVTVSTTPRVDIDEQIRQAQAAAV